MVRIEEQFEQRADCLKSRISKPTEAVVEESLSPGAELHLLHLTMHEGETQVRCTSVQLQDLPCPAVISKLATSSCMPHELLQLALQVQLIPSGHNLDSSHIEEL